MLAKFEPNRKVRNVQNVEFFAKKNEFFKTIFDKALTPFCKAFLQLKQLFNDKLLTFRLLSFSFFQKLRITRLKAASNNADPTSMKHPVSTLNETILMCRNKKLTAVRLLELLAQSYCTEWTVLIEDCGLISRSPDWCWSEKFGVSGLMDRSYIEEHMLERFPSVNCSDDVHYTTDILEVFSQRIITLVVSSSIDHFRMEVLRSEPKVLDSEPSPTRCWYPLITASHASSM